MELNLLNILGVIAFCSFGLFCAGFSLYRWRSGGWRGIAHSDEAPHAAPTQYRDLDAELRAAATDVQRTKNDLGGPRRD